MEHPDLMYIDGSDGVAAYLKKTPGAVRMMIARGLLPHRRMGGRIVCFRSEIDAALRAAPGLRPEDMGISLRPTVQS